MAPPARIINLETSVTSGNYAAWLCRTRGFGKALALDTAIATADGWSTMGRLRARDKVYDECGRPCRVPAAHPAQLG